jgi:nitroreductase
MFSIKSKLTCFGGPIMVKSLTTNDEVDIYDAIFKRRSIRKYDDDPLDEKILNDISDHINKLKPLHEDIKIDIKIVTGDDIKLRGMKRASHYLAVFTEEKEGYLVNIGFMLQQMDLLFSASGIGSCWQGIPTPKNNVIESSNLKFIILIAFGKPSEPLYRKDISKFKRKSIQEITDIKDEDSLLEAARLAPSAINHQPWFFTGNSNIVHACSNKPNFLKAVLVNKYIPIDVGIAIYHLKVSAEHYNKNIEILPCENINPPKNRICYATLKLENRI